MIYIFQPKQFTLIESLAKYSINILNCDVWMEVFYHFFILYFKLIQPVLSNKRKLHFTTINYVLNYTLHPKLSNCTLCTLNYHTYHTLHPGVIFAIIFNRIMLHVTNTCFLLRWNKVERLKYPSSSFPHSFSDFFLWSENMNRKIKENQTSFMIEFSSFETRILSFQIINEPHCFN